MWLLWAVTTDKTASPLSSPTWAPGKPYRSLSKFPRVPSVSSNRDLSPESWRLFSASSPAFGSASVPSRRCDSSGISVYLTIVGSDAPCCPGRPSLCLVVYSREKQREHASTRIRAWVVLVFQVFAFVFRSIASLHSCIKSLKTNKSRHIVTPHTSSFTSLQYTSMITQQNGVWKMKHRHQSFASTQSVYLWSLGLMLSIQYNEVKVHYSLNKRLEWMENRHQQTT